MEEYGNKLKKIKDALTKFGFRYDMDRKLWIHPRGYVLEDEFLKDIDTPIDLRNLLEEQQKVLRTI